MSVPQEPPSKMESRRVARPIPTRSRTLSALVVGVLVLLAVRFAVAEPFRIPSASMEPTLRPGDHVVVDKVAYRLGEPRRGDLVAFDDPRGGGALLKRVAALPGDRVEIRDGVLFVDDGRVPERYVDYEMVDGEYFGPVRVPRGRVFVLGDNRGNSDDSRDYGAVPRSALIGRVELRVWPLDGLRRF